MRYAARVDENHSGIVKHLEQIGMTVWSAASQGNGKPDLIVGWRGVNGLFEVKNPKRRGKQRQLRDTQKTFFELWKGQVAKAPSSNNLGRLMGVDIDPALADVYPGEFLRDDVFLVTGQSVRNVIWARCARQKLGLIVASPPCQEFSRHDQPWTRKRNPPPPDTSIWEACVRIAGECGGPLILENVRGAQKFMGSAKWHCGPYYLWGDVPALMPRFSWRHKENRSSGAVAERSMVPFELALHIGQVFHPREERCA